jgi:hypothetical protein
MPSTPSEDGPPERVAFGRNGITDGDGALRVLSPAR